MIAGHRSLVTVAAAAILAGCGCISMQEADAMDAELALQNSARHEQAMRAAAAQHGATLMPSRVRSLPPECPDPENPHPSWPSTIPKGCVQPEHVGGRVYRLSDARGVRQTAVLIERTERGVRVARRGTTLLVLTPRLSDPKQVGNGTRCECDAMPQVLLPETLAVTFDDALTTPGALTTRVEEVVVPVTEDFIQWDCEVKLR